MTSFFFKNILIRGGGPPTYILCPSSYFTLAPALGPVQGPRGPKGLSRGPRRNCEPLGPENYTLTTGNNINKLNE